MPSIININSSNTILQLGIAKPLGEIAGNTAANITIAAATDGISVSANKGMSTLRTAALSKTVEDVAASVHASGNAPATVGGAELNGQTTVASSGTPPTTVAPQLQETALNSEATIGQCCEVHEANDLLLQNPSATMKDLNLTPAIRP